jgi:hypothetical protein
MKDNFIYVHRDWAQYENKSIMVDGKLFGTIEEALDYINKMTETTPFEINRENNNAKREK